MKTVEVNPNKPIRLPWKVIQLVAELMAQDTPQPTIKDVRIGETSYEVRWVTGTSMARRQVKVVVVPNTHGLRTAELAHTNAVHDLATEKHRAAPSEDDAEAHAAYTLKIEEAELAVSEAAERLSALRKKSTPTTLMFPLVEEEGGDRTGYVAFYAKKSDDEKEEADKEKAE